jgi:hypothetical protein
MEFVGACDALSQISHISYLINNLEHDLHIPPPNSTTPIRRQILQYLTEYIQIISAIAVSLINSVMEDNNV